MSDLIVLAFENETDAFKMRDELINLQKQEVITLQDAAVVVRHGDGKPKVKQATSLVGAGALGGAFWGMLIGLLFFAPWLGLAIGAVSGAIAGKFTDTGIDDKFIKEVGDTIKPGHSALFLLVSKVTMDKVQPTLEHFDATVIQTSLNDEQEAKLKELFTHADENGEEAAEAAEA
ncbi:MAG: DUF1269 domain-containing protein [Candidatus Promineifilaceae bacterium]|nr:DUF1269 domain-containing protein [Candidatus Promineifilaceae bacterium]